MELRPFPNGSSDKLSQTELDQQGCKMSTGRTGKENRRASPVIGFEVASSQHMKSDTRKSLRRKPRFPFFGEIPRWTSDKSDKTEEKRTVDMCIHGLHNILWALFVPGRLCLCAPLFIDRGCYILNEYNAWHQRL